MMFRSTGLFASLLSLGALVLAWTQIATTLGSSPAFNPDLQSQAVTGGNRPVARPAMYDRGEYLYQIAYGAANAPLLRLESPKLYAASLASDPVSAWTIARGTARASLSQAPANAYAWLVLATAEMSLGHDRAAVQALANSAMFAPNSWDIVDRRASLGALLYQTAPDQAEMLRPILDRDIVTLGRFDPDGLADLAEIFPEIAKPPPDGASVPASGQAPRHAPVLTQDGPWGGATARPAVQTAVQTTSQITENTVKHTPAPDAP